MEHVSMYDLIVWLHAIFDLGIVAARDSLMPFLPPSIPASLFPPFDKHGITDADGTTMRPRPSIRPRGILGMACF